MDGNRAECATGPPVRAMQGKAVQGKAVKGKARQAQRDSWSESSPRRVNVTGGEGRSQEAVATSRERAGQAGLGAYR